MKTINLLSFLILIVVMSTSIMAMDLNFYYDDYMETNVVENITLKSDTEITNESAYILIDGAIFNMTNLDNFSWGLSLIETIERDIPVIIEVGSNDYEQKNGSDSTNDGYLTIANSTTYSFMNKTDNNINDSPLEYNEVCAYFKRIKGSPNVRGVISHQNGTTDDADFHYSTARIITSNLYSYKCFELPYQYTRNFTDITEFYGIQCTNCDANNQISLGVDTTSPNSLSVYIVNGTNYSIDANNNFMIFAIEWEGYITSITDTLLFRDPYYITFNFFQGVNSSTKEQSAYKSLFDYVYMYEDNGTSSSSSLDYLNGITELVAMVPGTGDFYSNQDFSYDKDIQTFFWDQYSDGSATIKLYQLTKHDLNIMGSDIMTSSANFGEFFKPIPSDDRWQTLVTSIDFNSTLGGVKRNATFSIYLQPWEANKSQFMRDIIKWVAILSLLIIIIGVEIGLGVDAKVISYTIVAYLGLVGGIGWVV